MGWISGECTNSHFKHKFVKDYVRKQKKESYESSMNRYFILRFSSSFVLRHRSDRPIRILLKFERYTRLERACFVLLLTVQLYQLQAIINALANLPTSVDLWCLLQQPYSAASNG